MLLKPLTKHDQECRPTSFGMKTSRYGYRGSSPPQSSEASHCGPREQEAPAAFASSRRPGRSSHSAGQL